ncbi:MAG: alternative oxidase [Candidatus Paceibacterota bacterium]
MEPNAIDTGLMKVVPSVVSHEEEYTKQSRSFRDKFAKRLVKILAGFMDFIFQDRYCHRAVVLETIAAVPGMVGGLLQHLKSLRDIKTDRGWIKTLLDEAENERMHLLIYSHISRPNAGERVGILVIQFFFYHLYFLLYFFTPATAHRVVGYFEEEAIHSYEHYLKLVQEGKHENVQAPELAITYWKLESGARLEDVIKATIKDEMRHRDVNHQFAEDKVNTSLWF